MTSAAVLPIRKSFPPVVKSDGERQSSSLRSRELIGRVALAVAHDLSNQLMVISARARFALDALAAGSEGREHVEEIGLAATRAAVIVHYLGSSELLESQKAQPTDLGALLSRLEPVLSVILRKVRSVELAADRGTVAFVDSARVERLILALGLQSTDAGTTGGRLILTAGTRTAAPRLSMRFHEPANIPYAVLSLRGLGAVDVSAAADLMVNEVTAESDRAVLVWRHSDSAGVRLPDGGGFIVLECVDRRNLEVTLYLHRPPVAAALGSRSDTHVVPASTVATSRSGRTILVVDDEAPIRRAMARSLYDGGYQVLEARDGDEALLMADVHDRPIDLIVTDMDMPGVTWRELVLQLREGHPDLKTILISGSDAALVSEANDFGADGCVAKPFGLAQLVALVENVLAGTTGA